MGIERPQILTTDRYDVVIIGGGPSGLIAARDLAAAGLATLVVEEHERIGIPVHCTGILGADAFAELDLPRQTILHTAHAARFVSADGSTLVIDHDRVEAAVIDRCAFDAALAASAAAAGAEVRTGCHVRAVDTTPGGVIVSTAGGALQARASIIACGANYRFNRRLGLGLPRAFAHSAQLEVAFPASDHVEVYLGRQPAPGGFGWLVPFGRGGETFARVGVMCATRPRLRFRELTERIGARFGITPAWGEPRSKILPLAPVARTFADRVLAVGDAAGLVKATTGGGIYFGLLSGRIAAEVLIPALAADRLDARRLQEYERRWRERLWPEIRAGLAFRKMAARLNDGAIDALVELARVDGIVPLLKQTADFNWHRGAALSLLRNPSFRRVVFSSIWS